MTTEAKTTEAKNSLDPFFYPKSVAVIGTTDVEGSVPFDIFYNILKDRLRGIVYPVSPGKKHIAGVRTYKYVLDIEGPVDLGILVFPSAVCHMALEQCGQKGIKAVIIISAGFREVGGAGIEREQKIKDIAKKYGIRIIGPNCLGLINTDPTSHLNASFARKMPAEGNIGFLSQSGALCTAVLDYAQGKHIGFSKFVSFGNKADVSEIDLIYYLKDDPKTKVILLYLEEVVDGRGLMKAAEAAVREGGKPVLAIKSGRTSAGAAAAASHTGSLAGSDEICDAAFRQAGIIRCTTIEEMFNRAIALSYQPLPEKDRIAIITNAGGPGVLAADAAVRNGVELARFTEKTAELFWKKLPRAGNQSNPVDVIGDARADRYEIAVEGALADDNVDAVSVILTPQSMTDIEDIAQNICHVGEHNKKPLYTSFMGEMDVEPGIDLLQRHKIPHYILPEDMLDAFAASCRFRDEMARKLDEPKVFKDVDKATAQKVLEEAAKAGRHHLPEEEADKVLEAYKLPVVPRALVQSAEDAAKQAAKIGFPVVLKIVSDDVVHKFDVGGVVLNVADEKAASDAYNSIIKNVGKAKPDAKIKGVLVARMISGADEVILGVKQDNSFGHAIMFGLGGTFVEIFKDVSFRAVPIGKTSAAEMVQDVKAYKLLAGARGRNPRDIAAIEECLLRLSQLASDLPQIKELDINPLMVQDKGKGCHVADARIMI